MNTKLKPETYIFIIVVQTALILFLLGYCNEAFSSALWTMISALIQGIAVLVAYVEYSQTVKKWKFSNTVKSYFKHMPIEPFSYKNKETNECGIIEIENFYYVNSGNKPISILWIQFDIYDNEKQGLLFADDFMLNYNDIKLPIVIEPGAAQLFRFNLTAIDECSNLRSIIMTIETNYGSSATFVRDWSHFRKNR